VYENVKKNIENLIIVALKHKPLNLLHVSGCKMYKFCDKTKQSTKQTLESVHYELQITLRTN